MPEYAAVIGPCIACSQVISFHPNRVPSIRVNGTREPVCQACFDRLQRKRKEMGLDPWPDPLPGAYEAAPADEIDWESE